MSEIIPLPPPPRFDVSGNEWFSLGRDPADRRQFVFEIDGVVELTGSLDVLEDVAYNLLSCVSSCRIEAQRNSGPRASVRRTVRRVRRWWTS